MGRLRSRWLWRVGLVGLVLVFAGLGDDDRVAGLQMVLVGGLLLLGVAAAVQGRTGSAGVVRRLTARSRRRHGVASWWVLLRRASRFSVRRKMCVLRPSLRDLGFVRRLFVDTREVATPLARVGLMRVWSPVEDVTLRIGGPRVGKTGELAGRILDAPGAVIATSTRPDLVGLTASVRSRVGPVWVFNPCGLGRMTSTVVFDPLAGCEDPKTAVDRATDLLSGSPASGSDGGGGREFWQAQAVRVLSALMHAAAVGGASMRDVQRWVASPGLHAGDVQRCLHRSPHGAVETDAQQFLNTNQRTQTSISATIMPALGWLNDATAATAAGQNVQPMPLAIDADDADLAAEVPDVVPEEWSAATTSVAIDARAVPVRAGFDVEQLLEQRGTVYLLGAEDAQVAPLVCALTGHIARTARQLASELPSGRLDPPLTLALDEAALICPIPLDSWTADMGGRNVTIHIAVQSRAQIRQRWGDVGAAAIINNAATLLIFGGARDVEDLRAYATLVGDRPEQVATYGQHGAVISRTPQSVPVLSEAQFAQLPPGRVVIIRRGMPPALGRVRMAWKRHDVRHAARLARRVEHRRVSAVVRRQRSESWARRQAWIAARARDVACAIGVAITATAAAIERAEQAWIRYENKRRAARVVAAELEAAPVEAESVEVAGGRDA